MCVCAKADDLPLQKAVKIANGSSHYSTILMGGMMPGMQEVTPVVFALCQDQPVASLVPQKSQKQLEVLLIQRKIVLSPAAHQCKQDAFGHIDVASFSRRCVVH